LGHHDGKCSFEAILDKYGLTDPGLLILSRIVHGADTNDPSSHPAAYGLDAIASGFSLIFPDDQENLANQFTVYDALYAWCRLEAARLAK